MSPKIEISLNGSTVEADASATVLEVALEHDLFVPHLCHHPDLEPAGVCRLCLVEVDGRMVTACNTPVTAGAEIRTDTPTVQQTRLGAVELLLVNHHGGTIDCEEGEACDLNRIARFVGADEARLGRYRPPDRTLPVDGSNPFFTFDPGLCVLCGICVRTCDEIVGVAAIDFVKRGFDTTIGSAPGKQWIDSDCVSCGECVERCPTGSLSFTGFETPEYEVTTTCTYCGCGCGIHLGVSGDRIVSARGQRENPSNEGRLCVKGRFGFTFVNSPERLTTPLIRRNGALEEATWDEALDLVAERFSAARGDAFAAIASAKLTNEENYLIQKFSRAVMGTNNVDHCARLCHSPSVAGLVQSFGSGAMTSSSKDLGDARCIFAIGTNTTAAHPIIGLQIMRSIRAGGRLIVANPREIELARHADLFIQHRAGSDVALLMGMMRVIVEEGLHDPEFIESRCENFEAFQESLAEYDDATVEEKTGVPFAKIAEAARMYAENSPAAILYAMGITQHTHGTDNVLATSNLAMLTGNVGVPSGGVNPLRGQSNVQGACDMGALPNVYPGYQKVELPEVRAKFEQAWGADLDDAPGLTHLEILRGVTAGPIRAIYLVGENPALSEADATHAREAMEKVEFLVVQDIFLTESAEYADVVLPAASFAEKDGTFTNTERRVQRVRKVIPPVGESRSDAWITCEIARRMGASGFEFESAEAVMEEIASLTPSYGGITHDRIDRVGLQWPCPDPSHPGTRYLHAETFPRPGGRGRFVPLEYRPPDEEPDAEYPLVLTTERSLYHYHTATMTRRVPGLETLRSEELVEIHPRDAVELQIASGDRVRVTSRRGEVEAHALVTEASPPGTISMTFHFHESPTNVLTNAAWDPVAKIPETKVCAVRVERA
ncbi:MAG: formate dehydrogenase subunit alpha [marine benthic group bacterium]|nr:formate dehydrogenase subunit alpha [Gemmatimonadota bacterium]MCL7967047.1 formate dehydrogenase subunit alpha [Gemmatimonadota bacterium]